MVLQQKQKGSQKKKKKGKRERDIDYSALAKTVLYSNPEHGHKNWQTFVIMSDTCDIW